MRPFTAFLIAATLGAQIPGLPADVVESRLAEAAEDRKNRNYIAAEESYRELLAQTGDTRALRGLAALLFEQRRYSAAVALLEDYSSKRPEDLPLRLLLGDAYSQSGRHDRAIETYRAILEKQPAAWQVWIRQGEAQKRSGDLDGALTSFEKARELAPASPLPITQIAVLEESRGRFNEAIKLYESILARQPENPAALNNLAYILLSSGGDSARALILARRARSILPASREIADTYAHALLRNGQSEQALEIFDELIRLEPERATFHYGRALVLFERGDKAGAAAAAARGIELKPDARDEKALRALLAKLE